MTARKRPNTLLPLLRAGSPPLLLKHMTDPLGPSHSFQRILSRQREFSSRAFGPGKRTQGLIRHIEEECVEVQDSGHDISECVDVLILALDLCWRSGADLATIELALHAKMTKNEARKWPPVGSVGECDKINHVKEATDA
jgi:hypothetical protein